MFGPSDGCGYIPTGSTKQKNINTFQLTHAERVALCAAFCDETDGCLSFSMSVFPPCAPNGEATYCLVARSLYTSSSQMQCGIGNGVPGCLGYQDATVYK